MAKFDYEKAVKVLALAESPAEGEALNALRVFLGMARSAGLALSDIITETTLDAVERFRIASDTAAVLLGELNAAKAEIEELRRAQSNRAGPAAAPAWDDIGAQVTDTGAAAEWALDLARRGAISLNESSEIPFLQRCAGWCGRLTPKMQTRFDQLIAAIVRRTGLQPPIT